MLVRLVCVVVGRRRLVAVEVDALDFLDDIKSRIHDFLRIDSCRADDLKVYLAEKRVHRAWFRTDEEAVDDLRSDREPPEEFTELYLGEGNELAADERIQDFLPERFERKQGEVYLFLVAPGATAHTPLPVQVAAPTAPPVEVAAPKQPCTVVVKVRHRRYTVAGCSKYRRFGGFCISHGGGKQCTFNNCNKTARSGGFCRGHGGGARCKHEDCTKQTQKGDLCIGHGGTQWSSTLNREKSVSTSGFR